MTLSRYFNDPAISETFEDIAAVVFDLNGLLVDDEDVQRTATNYALLQYSVSLSTRDWELHCVGRSAMEYLPEFVAGITMEAIQELLKKKNEAYDALLRTSGGAIWKPGAITLLSWLICKNIPRALATSTTRKNMDILDLVISLRGKAQFDLTVCGDEVERAKPDPAIYLKVRRALGTNGVFLALEDSENGVRAAVGAGLKCILVPSLPTYNIDVIPGVHIVISSLEPDARVLSGPYA
jgi:beta-phosphoglucomutase-like phosphatase (HAD superfamily)